MWLGKVEGGNLSAPRLQSTSGGGVCQGYWKIHINRELAQRFVGCIADGNKTIVCPSRLDPLRFALCQSAIFLIATV